MVENNQQPTNQAPAPQPKSATAPTQSPSPRIDENGNPYSVQNPPKLPAPKPGEQLSFPPVPHIPPEPAKAPKTVEDRKLIASLLYMKQNNFMKESKSIIKFDTVKEAEDAAKEDIVSAINERTHNIQQDISEMQKKGHDLKTQIMKLLRIPLETNLWKSTRSAKELQKIFTIILQVEAIVNPIKNLQSKKDVENEQQLKNKEMELEQEFKTRKSRHQELFAPIVKPTPQTPKPVPVIQVKPTQKQTVVAKPVTTQPKPQKQIPQTNQQPQQKV